MKIADLNIPNLRIITEKEATIGDTLKTHAKAVGSRFLNKHMRNLGHLVGGGHQAAGRLATRQMTDELMKDWLNYKGSTGTKATRGNVFQFLTRNFGGHIDDHFLRSITGMPAETSQQEPEAAQQQPETPAPPAPQQQQEPQSKTPAATMPSTTPTPAAAGATPPPPQQQSIPFSKQIDAQLQGIFTHILDMYHPMGASRHTIRPAPNLARESWSPRLKLREAEETITSLLKSMLDIGRRGDDETKAKVISLVAELKRRRFTSTVPEIQSLPRDETMFDPSFVPSSAPQPTQPEAPPEGQPAAPAQQPAAAPQSPSTVTPAAAPAQTGVPIMITTQMKNKLAGLGYTPEQIMELTPEQAHQVIAKGVKHVPLDIDATLRKFAGMMQQPQVHSPSMMAALAKIIHQAEGTPKEQLVTNYIKSLQADPTMRAKLPQIAQITLESRRAIREADDETAQKVAEEPLSRSELDHMFVLVSQKLADNSLDSDTLRPPASRGAKLNGNSKSSSVDDDFRAAAHRRVSAINLQKILDANPVADTQDRATLASIQKYLTQYPETILGKLQVSMYPQDNNINAKMTPNVKSILLKAAKL